MSNFKDKTLTNKKEQCIIFSYNQKNNQIQIHELHLLWLDETSK